MFSRLSAVMSLEIVFLVAYFSFLIINIVGVETLFILFFNITIWHHKFFFFKLRIFIICINFIVCTLDLDPALNSSIAYSVQTIALCANNELCLVRVHGNRYRLPSIHHVVLLFGHIVAVDFALMWMPSLECSWNVQKVLH